MTYGEPDTRLVNHPGGANAYLFLPGPSSVDASNNIRNRYRPDRSFHDLLAYLPLLPLKITRLLIYTGAQILTYHVQAN
jgi:hypothetical protein